MPSIRRRGGPTLDEGLDIIPESDLAESDAGPNVTPDFPMPEELAPDLLNAPVGMDDDLTHALAARPQRSKLPGLTAVLAAAVLVAGGFLAGVLTQKHQGGSGTGNAASLAAAFRNRAGGAAGTGAAGATGAAGTGAAAGAGAASGTTVGTVKLVDGNTIYVTTTDGSIVKVTTGAGTTIKVTKNGKATDLAPGSTVVVAGKAGSDGVVAATTVTQGGGAGGFGGGGFGGGRNRTGGAGGANG